MPQSLREAWMRALPSNTDIAADRESGGALPWLLLLLSAAAMAVAFDQGLLYVAQQWQREEYSYGYIVPPITALLVWARLRSSPVAPAGGSWFGVALVAFAIVIASLARLGGMPSAVFYAFMVALWGLFLATLGWRPTWHVTPALAYLLFALPLPSTLYVKVSTTLQMVSTRWSVDLMRALGVTVFRDGNVIDLGTYKLQVAEACSGLGYLFPLASFAYLLAYLYARGWTGRIVILLSAVPITVAINVLRIAITGVLVDHVGTEAAEGFIHAFEGYAIFFVGVVLFLILIRIIARLGGYRGPMLGLFRFDLIWPAGSAGGPWRPVRSPSLVAGSTFLVAAAAASLTLPKFPLETPERASLAAFPMQVDDWRGNEGDIDRAYLDVLRLDDYVVADYARTDLPADVNFYVAYYKAQNEVSYMHSPKVCIPAGGWEITEFSKRSLTGIGALDGPLEVNRAVIGKGLDRHLVYYWFELRGRRMTDEYTIKVANLWDAFTRRRTDGALVRVMTSIGHGEDPAAADRRLEEFVRSVYPRLESHVPH